MNYFDILLAKKLEDDRDPKVEGLSVTENGRYHEDGVVYDPVIVEVPEPTLISKSITANGNYSASADNADGYSSVSVNVPLPSNAYLLQTIEHESIATFADGTDNFLKSLEVAIEPIQSGSGDPSPENIRPISGWDECKVTVADDVENPTVENVYTIDLDGTRYGGKVDLVSGVMTVDREYVDLGSLTYGKYKDTFYADISNPKRPPDSSTIGNLICSEYVASSLARVINQTEDKVIALNNSSDRVNIYDSSYANLTTEQFKTAMSGVQLVYELATPLTIQLTPTPVISLDGVNNVWVDSGDVLDLSYFGKEV